DQTGLYPSRFCLIEGGRAKGHVQVQNLQHEVEAKEKQFRDAKSHWEALEKELAWKSAENTKLKKDLKRLKSKSDLQTRHLGSQPLENLSTERAKEMLKENDFFDNELNPRGKGLLHQYEAVKQGEEKLILDHSTALTWQQFGSPNYLTYADWGKHISDLNDKNFAGYNDWRLPTLEEAMSLMEPEKIGDLHLDPVFDRKQSLIWTSDKESAGTAWVVVFSGGLCFNDSVNDLIGSYVRAVRGGQS
ncbi:MAG TPA: DUF1566 domain-containing protein, partial [bacterium]